MQDNPVGVDYKVLKFGNKTYYLYKKSGTYYCEQPYQFIHQITEVVYQDALEFAENPSEVKRAAVSPEIVSQVERFSQLDGFAGTMQELSMKIHSPCKFSFKTSIDYLLHFNLATVGSIRQSAFLPFLLYHQVKRSPQNN